MLNDCWPRCLERARHRYNPATPSFDGIGKPEPLKYLGSDVWSRRITQEHRFVYLVKADRVEFLQGRYHY